MSVASFLKKSQTTTDLISIHCDLCGQNLIPEIHTSMQMHIQTEIFSSGKFLSAPQKIPQTAPSALSVTALTTGRADVPKAIPFQIHTNT